MSTTIVDQLVADYLERLHRAAGSLPHDRARELEDEIGAHITSARADGAAGDEAAVRTMLDRLGTPEEIVAAARDDVGPLTPVPARPPGTGLELAAVLMLTAGSFVPVVGWLVGVVLLWSSRRWTTAEKLLGTLVVPLGPGGVLVLRRLFGTGYEQQACSIAPVGTTGQFVESCTTSVVGPWLSRPMLVVLLVVPVLVAVWLYRRASARAALEPPQPTPAPGSSPWGGLEIAAVAMLATGALLTFVVPLVPVVPGLVLVWCSQQWTGGEKMIATGLSLGPGVLATLAFVLGSSL